VSELSALGSGSLPSHGSEGLEAVAGSPRLAAAELICRCPVTQQPDIYRVVIRYGPHPERPRALETKSVKLWLWSFQQRDEGVFAEDIAAEIAHAVAISPATPAWVDVVLVQNPRGGITTTVHATEGDPPT
jgi:NADPH-dependent 7-cyano-7-deazaguanine reductase QueF